MNNRWLVFLVMGFFSVVTILFYWIKTNPIDLTPAPNHNNPVSMTEPTVTFVNPTKGAKSPRLTIIEFSDFSCSHCQTTQVALDAVLKAFPTDVRIVWKDLPNPSAYPESIPSTIAAHCADRQGKFWEYHDALFARQSYLSQEVYGQIADELKLNKNRFDSCIASQDTMPIIQKDREEGLALGIIATPTLYVGSQKIVGAVTAEELVQIVQTELQTLDL